MEVPLSLTLQCGVGSQGVRWQFEELMKGAFR